MTGARNFNSRSVESFYFDIESYYVEVVSAASRVLKFKLKRMIAMATTTWKIDAAHSSAEFKVKHMMISNVKGSFSGLSGVLEEDAANPAGSQVEAAIEVNSISTGDAGRDAHLKGAEFFDTETFPVMTFKSTKVEKVVDKFVVSGDLTLHGVTKVVKFEVEGPSAPGKDPWGNIRIGLSATTKINRKDFGLGWNSALETGGVLVGEEVSITLEVQFIKS
jgi:polyisoprenoid-binding protein YceI